MLAQHNCSLPLPNMCIGLLEVLPDTTGGRNVCAMYKDYAMEGRVSDNCISTSVLGARGVY
jgi:hypothetical protein